MGLEEGGRKLTKTGMIFGTPDYMSPEQATGQKLDHRLDIYALGVILYEMITGTLPFKADSFMAILTKHMFEAPAPPSSRVSDINILPEVDALVLKALAKKPSDRFQSMNDFAQSLDVVGGVDPVIEASGPILLTSPKPAVAMGSSEEDSDATETVDALPQPGDRSRMLTWIGLGVLILLVAALGLLLVTRNRKQNNETGSPGATAQASNKSDAAMVPAASGVKDAATPPVMSGRDASISAMASVPTRQAHPTEVHIWVKTKPSEADVYLDGKRIGRTPIVRFAVPYGTDKHTVILKRHHYRTTTIEFVPDGDQHWTERLARPDAGSRSTSRQRPVHRPRSRARARTRPRGMHNDLKTPSWGMNPD